MTKNQKRMILPVIIAVLVVLMLALGIIFLGADMTLIIMLAISLLCLSALSLLLAVYFMAKFIMLYVLAGVLTDNELEEVKLSLDYMYYNAISEKTLKKILSYLKNKIKTSKCKFVYERIFIYFDSYLIYNYGETFYKETLDK